MESKETRTLIEKLKSKIQIESDKMEDIARRTAEKNSGRKPNDTINHQNPPAIIQAFIEIGRNLVGCKTLNLIEKIVNDILSKTHF